MVERRHGVIVAAIKAMDRFGSPRARRLDRFRPTVRGSGTRAGESALDSISQDDHPAGAISPSRHP
jgi:hypothetical protein